MYRRSLTLITYSQLTEEGPYYYVNRVFGQLIDQLAEYFEHIYYVVADTDKNSSLYYNGKSIYSYRIKSKNVALVRIEPTYLTRNFFVRCFITLKNQFVISKVIKNTDLIYIFMPGFSGLFSAFIAFFYRKKYFFYFGSDWHETGLLRLNWRGNVRIFIRFIYNLYIILEKFVVKNARFCLVAGKKLFDYYSRLKNSTYETVPLVQFNTSFSQHRDLSTMRQLDGQVNLLFVGPVTAKKGVEYLIRSVDILLKKNISVKLLLVGSIEQSYRKKIDTYLKADNLAKAIEFKGYVSDVTKLIDYYLNSDIFILPTLGEGFPRVIYEAMLSGLPVIASDIPSIRENFDGKEPALLVPPENPQAIADTVIELCRNGELRKTKIKAGFKFAEMKLSGNPAEQLVCLIKKVI